MKQYYFNEAQKLPLVIEPNGSGKSMQDLQLWMKSNQELIKKHFYEDGALLFRGFEVDSPKKFEDVALSVDPGLKNDYYGTSPRNIVKGTTFVYTASELPGYYPIMQHCEMTYVTKPPISLFFYCETEPQYGGETPVCNFRKVYAQMDERIRKDFEEKGVITVRNYSGLQSVSKYNLFELKKWNEIFLTEDPKEVERQCKEQDIEYEWLPNGNLRLLHRTPAVISHPVTGEKVWFNHLQVFHPHGADTEYAYIHRYQKRFKTLLWAQFLKVLVQIQQATKKPVDQSMNVLFGDGTEVPNSYVEHIEEIIWRNMVIFPWKKNDVLAIDNFSTSHGRLPYEGPRNILVCWSA